MTAPADLTILNREMMFEEFLAWAEAVPKEAGRFEQQVPGPEVDLLETLVG